MDNRMLMVAAVPLIIWIGIFIYLLALDRKVARMEANREEDDL